MCLQSRLKVHFPTIQDIYSDCFIIILHQTTRNTCSANGEEQQHNNTTSEVSISSALWLHLTCKVLSLLLPKGQAQPGAVVMGFLSVCREPGGGSCDPACKGGRKSVFLNQTASQITSDSSSSHSCSDTGTIHPKALGEVL